MNARYDVLTIGNAIVDVIAQADEAFLTKTGVVKGSNREEPAGWRGTFTLRVTDKEACIEAAELWRHEVRIRADLVRSYAEEDDGTHVREIACEMR